MSEETEADRKTSASDSMAGTSAAVHEPQSDEHRLEEILVVSCPDCQSTNVRLSQSSYPLDPSKVAGRDASFWRCENCGDRFAGPPAPEPKRRKSRRGGRHSDHSLDRSSPLGRAIKEWLFPVLVIISTILAVAYILDRRNTRQDPSIISPD